VLKMVVHIRNNLSAQRFHSVKGCNCFQSMKDYVNCDYELTFAVRHRISSRGQKWREYIARIAKEHVIKYFQLALTRA
jgi:hypothetical protein